MGVELKMLNLVIGILEHERIAYEPAIDGTLGVYANPNDPKLCKFITDFYQAVDYLNSIQKSS